MRIGGKNIARGIFFVLGLALLSGVVALAAPTSGNLPFIYVNGTVTAHDASNNPVPLTTAISDGRTANLFFLNFDQANVVAKDVVATGNFRSNVYELRYLHEPTNWPGGADTGDWATSTAPLPPFLIVAVARPAGDPNAYGGMTLLTDFSQLKQNGYMDTSLELIPGEGPRVGYGIVGGSVTVSGTSTPIGGASVTLVNAADPLIRYLATSGSDGVYLVPAVLPGIYNIACLASNYEPQTLTNKTVVADHVKGFYISMVRFRVCRHNTPQ